MGATMSMRVKRLSEDASAPSGAEIVQMQDAQVQTSEVYEHVCTCPSPHCSESRSFSGSKSERHTIRNRISALMSKIKMHRTSAEEYSEDTSGPRGTESVRRKGRLKNSDMVLLLTQTNDELQKRVTELRQFYLQQSKELKDIEDRLQEATDCIVQLESEKSILKDLMHADRQMLQDMGELVADSHRECDELMKEREEGRKARHVLEAEIDRMQRHIQGATKIGKP